LQFFLPDIIVYKVKGLISKYLKYFKYLLVIEKEAIKLPLYLLLYRQIIKLEEDIIELIGNN
jgi:hypothetical protein